MDDNMDDDMDDNMDDNITYILYYTVGEASMAVGTRITNSLVHCFPLLPGKVATQF